jgi:hypothetical protein
METKDFIRQKNNPGALLNVNNAGLEEYRNKKRTLGTLKIHEEKIKNLEKTIEELKDFLAKNLKVEQ